MITTDDIPDDVDGDVLKRMRVRGDSLTQARPIDFSVVFPTEQAAHAFCETIADPALEIACEESNSDKPRSWDVTVTREMVPDHAAIVAMEGWLATCAEPFDGMVDGWGCFHVEDLNQD